MQSQILFPMGALAFLTFTVLLFVPMRRFRAVFAGAVGPGDFRLGESERVPPSVLLPNRNYMNLTELPVLFYVACLMFYVTNRVDETVLYVAWGFVGCRALHSLIHITYNNVIHRLSVFAISTGLLLWLWLMFFTKGA
ncbi:MAG TPA: MAPEG family protein [Rhizomicrobium sp.]|nr:MAPEG family protein [Rhizomicrobium sp.]